MLHAPCHRILMYLRSIIHERIMWEIHSSEKIRIKDIAERSGVSVGTVDRVLHDRPNV